MKCGIRNSASSKAPRDSRQTSAVEAIKRWSEAGFQTLDLEFRLGRNDGNVLIADDWESMIDELGETAARYGMTFCQLHLPTYKKGSDLPEYDELFDKAMRRALIAGGHLGAPWAVAHGLGYDQKTGNDPELAYRKNREFYDRYVEIGAKNGIGIAFENMKQGLPGKCKIQYCGQYQELIDLVDGYGDPMVGICWDFGHANITGVDQCTALRKIGKRLKCVHIHDNFGDRDQHLLPFAGMVDWQRIFPVLAEIGYEGECNLEAEGHFRRVPRELQQDVAMHAANICRYLIGLYEEKAEQLRKEGKGVERDEVWMQT